MANFFHAPDAKRHFRRNFIFFAIVLAVLIFNKIMQDNEMTLSIDSITIAKPVKIGAKFDGDSVFTKFKVGESLNILGISPAGTDDPQRLWVEASDGTRGWVDDAELGVPMVALDEKNGKRDTVSIVRRETFGYVCRYADGSEDKVDFDKVKPVMPEGKSAKLFGKSVSFKSLYMTADKFEKEFLGATFDENERKYRPAIDVAIYKDSLRAKYPIKVIDVTSGLNYMPVVTYDNKSMRAISVTCAHVDDRCDWLLRLLPFAGMIIDNKVLAGAVNGSFFDPYPVDENDESIWTYILGGLLIVGGLFWLYATQTLFVHIMAWLMHVRFVFYPIGNKALKAFIVLVGVVCTYVWFVLLLAWGMFWFAALPMFIASYIAIKHAIEPLDSSIPPCERCPKCRRIYTMNYFNERYVGEYDMQEHRTDSKVIGKDTKHWNTWTEVTTTYADGHKTKENKNYQSHKSTITTHQLDHYNVDYNVKVYKDLYRCSECGKIVGYHRKDYEETGRKYLGSETETTEKQNY